MFLPEKLINEMKWNNLSWVVWYWEEAVGYYRLLQGVTANLLLLSNLVLIHVLVSTFILPWMFIAPIRQIDSL